MLLQFSEMRIRTTEAEQRQVAKLSAAAGMTLSNFVRKLLGLTPRTRGRPRLSRNEVRK